MSATKNSDAWSDRRTETPGIYRRGNRFRVLTRDDDGRKVMTVFDTYGEAVAFKTKQPVRGLGAKGSRTHSYYSKDSLCRNDPCAYCGAQSNAIDHIVPRSKGGSNEWDNLTASCSTCNSKKNASTMLLFLARRNGSRFMRRTEECPRKHARKPQREVEPLWLLLAGEALPTE